MLANNKKFKELLSLSLILISIIFRLIPHPPNFTPVTAIALFGAFSFNNKLVAFFVPLFGMFISDCFIGFHTTMLAVYLSLCIITFIGFILKKRFSIKRLFFIVSLSSFVFYLITNFAVWLTSGMYSHDVQGLIQCYFFGLPFYKTSPIEFFAYSFISDLVYSFTLFGAYFLVEYFSLKQKIFRRSN
ncbi:MAG: DUF6580 family putative transport protein [Candidatus Kapaibacteriales bacterium]